MNTITLHYQKNEYGKGARKPAQWAVRTNGDQTTDVFFVLEPRNRRAKETAFQAARAHAATLGAKELRRVDRYTFTSEPLPAKPNSESKVHPGLLAQGIKEANQPGVILHRASSTSLEGLKNSHKTKNGKSKKS